LGQPVIVENRPSNLTAEAAMKALPDGYTLLVEGNSFWVAPLIRKTPYEVLRDFTPVTVALTAPNILVVHPSVAANSVTELIALAKAKAGQLNYGSAGTGGSLHLAMEMLKSMTKTDIVHVPYKGIGPALTGLIANEVQVMCSTAAALAPFTKSGKLKALAVTSSKPSPLLPGLPTVATTVPGYEIVLWTGLFAVGKPPRPVINRLNQEIARALNSAEIREKFFNAGVETVGNTPEQFTAIIKSEIVSFGKVIKDAGIKGD
jgi:tripartite-type tricarboxylate transporter receptor subunit TctC